jgi:MFS family permease
MDSKVEENTVQPLGVIAILRAGFEMVSRHIWLITLPILLDLFLWLGPRISTAPLNERFVAFLASQPMPDPAVARQIQQLGEIIGEMGGRSNLLSLLSALPILDVPSLLARQATGMVTPLGEPQVLLVTSVLALLGWVVVLIPAGPVLGFVYLNSLARRVRAMETDQDEEGQPEETVDPGDRVKRGINKLLSMFLFVAGLLMAVVVLVPLWSMAVGTVLMIAPPIGFLAWMISVGLGGYLALHLMFVVHGVLLGERGLFRATVESFMLIQTQFPSVMGLILLALVIYEGLGFVWSLPGGDSWALLVGIVGNGCIATGLTAATFVFYRERIGQLPEFSRLSRKNQNSGPAG